MLSPGWIRLAGDLIDAVGPGDAPDQPTSTCAGRWMLPGFVDLHVHGGGGASFTEGTADAARQAAAFHRRRGTTTMLASLVTAPLAELESRSALLAELAAEDLIAGLHLEGPFLSPARSGAQDPRYLMAPDPPSSSDCTPRPAASCASSPWPRSCPARSRSRGGECGPG